MTEIAAHDHWLPFVSIHTSAREVTCFIPFRKTITAGFNPHFRKGSDCKCRQLVPTTGVSIHTSAREVTAIFRKKLFQFLWNITKYIWIYFRISLQTSFLCKSTLKFVYFFWCESSGDFMYTWHSHLRIIKIKADRPRFRVLHLYALPWFYNYFQDSKSVSYLLYHQ